MNTERAAKKAGVPSYQLLRWQRDGKLFPKTNGANNQARRLEWSNEDVEHAKNLKNQADVKSQAEIIIDELGGRVFIDSIKKAGKQKTNVSTDEIVIIGPNGYRIVKKKSLLVNVLLLSGTPAIILDSKNI